MRVYLLIDFARPQSKLCLTSGPKTEDERNFMLYGALKMVFMEQVLHRKISYP